MGLRASDTAGSASTRRGAGGESLGDENDGFKLAMTTLDRTRPGAAAMATARPRRVEFATQYSKQRVQFGDPIACTRRSS